MRIRTFLLSICICLLSALCFLPAAPIRASADTGPKPSVRITVNGLGDKECFATLLGVNEQNGPWGKWGGDEWYDQSVPNEFPNVETMLRFKEYAENDGMYFYGRGWKLSEGEELAWTYYPPSRFKLLLYFPDTETFLVSQTYVTYAFHSYYQTDVDRVSDGKLSLSNAYGYGREALGLTARVGITAAVELLIALLYRFRGKQFVLLAGVNVGTQILLNIGLNLFGVQPGGMGYLLYVPAYLFLEILVFVIESILYTRFMNKLAPSGVQRPNRTYVKYALLANVVSFVVGVIIAPIFPSIF